MTRDQITSLIRHILSAAGGILIAKGVLDTTIVMTIIGTVLGIVSIFWSIRDHNLDLGKVEGVVRQLGTLASFYFVGRGIIDQGTLDLILGSIIGILATVLGQTDKLWGTEAAQD
jgi:hypothetical protein